MRPESDAAYNTAVFSAKEAFFKAYFPMTEHFLGFQDAVVRFHEGTERFDISIVNPAVPALFGRRQFDGMTLICKGEVVSVLWIATNDGPQRVPKPGRPDSVNGQTDLPSEPI